MDAPTFRRDAALRAEGPVAWARSGLSRALRGAVLALCIAVASEAAAATKGPIRWIADDWPRALAEGRKRDALVVVDAWAPW